MKQPLILVVNPGSASRKYAVFQGSTQLADVHFETVGKQVVYGINGSKAQPAGITHVTFALSKLGNILLANNVIARLEDLDAICVRIVAPSPYFQKHRLLNKEALKKLQALEHVAPLHVSATLQEVTLLEKFMPVKKLYGISDSAFHATMPDYAHSYGIPQKDTDKLDIQRYGYHGLSVASIVHTVKNYHSTPDKLVVCHLGSGASVTAIQQGKSIDTTMGYSPLEGLLMATRSGNIDPTAAYALQSGLKLSASQLQDYLNQKSGLLGVSGLSSDIRELLEHEKTDNEAAQRALQMYVYKIQQAIGQMSAALGGIDTLVFTGTVGERSAIIRQRVCHKLHFLGVELDSHRNTKATNSESVSTINHSGSPVAVYVIKNDEMGHMDRAATLLLSAE